MKPAPFAYHAPASLPEATALLATHGEDAKVLAGGQSLVPMLAFRLVTPGHLVDIGRVAGLFGYSLDERELRIRAGARQREIERSAEVGFAFPVLHEAIAHVAHAAIRNRGTVCGSLAHADPAAELPAVMVALRATMVAEGPDGRREIPADEFFLFHLTSALRPDEILTEVRVPRPVGALTFGAFDEVSRRRGDFALVGAAVVARFDGTRVADCRIVCSGVGATPFLATGAAGAVLGTELGDDVLLDAQRAAGSGMHPTDDIHATAAYRRQVAGVLVRRCLTRIRAEQGALT